MPVQIAAHHVRLTEGVRREIEEKARHLLRVFDGLSTIHVTLSAQKKRRVAEWVANVSHGAPVVAKVAADTLRLAIHEAAEKVEAQLRKHKDKLRDHRVREQEAEQPSPAPAEPPEESDEPWAPEESESTEAHDVDASEEAQ